MNRYIAVALLLLIAVAIALRLFPIRTTEAAEQDSFGACVSQVPVTWGQFKSGSEQSGIAFEDAHGTLRFITSFPCNGTVPPVALVVKRIPGN